MIFLSSGIHIEALDIYNQELHEKAPGHPVASLNRSLCYLCSNTTLAAIDACKDGDQVLFPLVTLQIDRAWLSATFETDKPYFADPGFCLDIYNGPKKSRSLKRFRECVCAAPLVSRPEVRIAGSVHGLRNRVLCDFGDAWD